MEPIDQARREGDGVLARDQASLALVRHLKVLFVDVIQALGDDPVPHGVAEVFMSAEARIH